jgi:hypothetical protein
MGMPTPHRKSPPAHASVPPADACDATTTSAARERKNGAAHPPRVREIGGPAGPEPTRFGDWEKNGRCIDF